MTKKIKKTESKLKWIEIDRRIVDAGYSWLFRGFNVTDVTCAGCKKTFPIGQFVVVQETPETAPHSQDEYAVKCPECDRTYMVHYQDNRWAKNFLCGRTSPDITSCPYYMQPEGHCGAHSFDMNTEKWDPVPFRCVMEILEKEKAGRDKLEPDTAVKIKQLTTGQGIIQHGGKCELCGKDVEVCGGTHGTRPRPIKKMVTLGDFCAKNSR